jgi:outer membrane protein assembly factor BamB
MIHRLCHQRLALSLVLAFGLLAVSATSWPGALAAESTSRLIKPSEAYRVCSFTLQGDVDKRIGNLKIEATFHLVFRDGTAVSGYAVQRESKAEKSIRLLQPESLTIAGDRLTGVVTCTFGIGRDCPSRLQLDGTVKGESVTGTYDWELPFPSQDKIVMRFKGDLAATLRTADQLRAMNVTAPGTDWACWHGPRASFAGVDGKAKLVDSLADARVVWQSETEIHAGRGGEKEGGGHPCGGYASPIVGQGRVFLNQWEPSGDTLASDAGKTRDLRIDADDAVTCFDAATGQLMWKRVFPGASVNLGGSNKHVYLNNTGVYHDGRVYVFGFTWRIYCLDAKTGDLIWESNLGAAYDEAEKAKQAGLAAKQMVSIPDENKFLDVADGVLFVFNLKGGVTGFDLATGKPLWTVPAGVVVNRWEHGGRQFILAQQDGQVVCIAPKTGETVWKSPVEGALMRLGVSGNRLVTYINDKNVSANSRFVFYTLDDKGATKSGEVTGIGHVEGWNCLDGDQFYLLAIDTQTKAGKIVRIDLAAGKVAAQVPMSGGYVGWALGMFVANGRLLVIPDGCHARSDLDMYDAMTLQPVGPRWAPPHLPTSAYDAIMAIPYVDGRLYFRGMKRIYCYDLRKTDP